MSASPSALHLFGYPYFATATFRRHGLPAHPHDPLLSPLLPLRLRTHPHSPLQLLLAFALATGVFLLVPRGVTVGSIQVRGVLICHLGPARRSYVGGRLHGKPRRC